MRSFFAWITRVEVDDNETVPVQEGLNGMHD